MLSKKEKKAIELLKQQQDLPFIYCERENAVAIILNLIKKQQNEIERLKANHKELHDFTTDCLDSLKDCVHKDKIREIINKYVNIEEHLKYTNQELFGEDLKNMIIELLEE